MKKIILMTLSLLIISGIAGGEALYAQRVVDPHSKSKKVTVVKSPKVKTVNKLPSKSVTMTLRGVDYFINGSKYYKKESGKFILTVPPIGLKVSLIPALHTTFIFNQKRHYCANGVIYVATNDNQFEVVEPMVGMIVPELPEVNVRTVSIDGTIYYEFEGILYKQIPTETGLQYKVSGTLND